jgi:hypothetical protein
MLFLFVMPLVSGDIKIESMWTFWGKEKSCQGQRRGKIPGRREPLGESTFKVELTGGGDLGIRWSRLFSEEKSVRVKPVGEPIFKYWANKGITVNR